MSHPLVRAKIAYFTDLDRWTLHGVVHVGANDGEEIPYYLHHDHRPIIAFEPHPAPFAELQREYGDKHGVICVNAALGDRDGELELREPEPSEHQSNKGTSALTPIPTPEHPWTLVPMGQSFTVPLKRFDSWVAETCIDMSPFDTLVVDAQGMELPVLHGFGRRLDGFKFLNVECSEKPVYEGEAAADEVIEFLRTQGFRQETPTQSHDDVLFVRVGPPEPPTELGRPSLKEFARDNGWTGNGPISRAIKQRYEETYA